MNRTSKKKIKEFQITEPLDEKDPPKPHEKKAARIIALEYRSDILFIRKTDSCSPDILIKRTNEIWEIKSPLGDGKRTIDNNLREASDQAKNVFLDLSRIKMSQEKAVSKAKNFVYGKWKHRCHLKRLRVILKNGTIIDIK